MGRNSTKSTITKEGRERLREKAKAQWAAARIAKENGGGLKAAAVIIREVKEPPANAVEIIQKACANGCTVEQIAAAFGIGRTTFLEWRERYPALEAAMTAGRAVEHDKLVGALFTAATENKNITAAIFLLKARHGYVEGVPLVQNTVSINFTLPGAMTPEAYVKTVGATAQVVPPDAARALAGDPKVKRALKNDFAAERRKLAESEGDE
jgi:hypothetical protein